MAYFYQEIDPGKEEDEYDEFFDVVFRVVISLMIPCPGSAFRLEAPSGITLSGDDELA